MSANDWRRRLDDRLDEKTGDNPRQDPPRRETPVPQKKAAPPPKPRARKTVAAIRRDKPLASKRPSVKSKPIPSASLVPHSRALSRIPLPQIDSKDYHSLRAAVLITCIVFGMAVGFLYNISKDNTMEIRPAKPSGKTQSGEAATPEQLGQEGIETVTAVETLPLDSINPDATADLIKETQDQLGVYTGLEVFLEINSGEYPTLLSKEPYGGLTGANAPPPEFASELQGAEFQLSPGLPLRQKTLAPDIDLDF